MVGCREERGPECYETLSEGEGPKSRAPCRSPALTEGGLGPGVLRLRERPRGCRILRCSRLLRGPAAAASESPGVAAVQGREPAGCREVDASHDESLRARGGGDRPGERRGWPVRAAALVPSSGGCLMPRGWLTTAGTPLAPAEGLEGVRGTVWATVSAQYSPKATRLSKQERSWEDPVP
ncbi:uncharacterized protein [Odocoileus virginianus]|uniref:Uncharacterized protein n=1 Tax=Odocoileus virginianus TaxID=9874 RepID=A0ABM4I9U0_ODOVR